MNNEDGKTKIVSGEVFEGMIYMQGETLANLTNIEFRNNTSYLRSLIQTKDNSFFTLNNSRFIDNKGVSDASLIYIEGPEDEQIYN